MIEWRGRRNGRPQRCERCKVMIAADGGLLCTDDGRWIVLHVNCAPPEIQEQVKEHAQQAAIAAHVPASLALELVSPTTVEIKPTGFLGRDLFNRFLSAVRSCCRGERHGSGYRNLVDLDRLGEAVQAFERAGFALVPSEQLQAAVEARRAQVEEVVQAAQGRLEQIDSMLAASGKSLYPFQRQGVEWLAPRAGALLADDMGLGKGHPVDTQVLTPSGWRRVGDLRPGDSVVGSDGSPVRVTGVHPRGRLPVFRVRFNDRSSVLVDGEHLWAVRTASGRARDAAFKVRETRQLVGDLRDGSGNRKWSIPTLTSPARFSWRSLLVDPYLLGVWIGDGSAHTHNVKFTPGDEKVPGEVGKVLGVGLAVSAHAQHGKSTSYAVVKESRGSLPNSAFDGFRALGFPNLRSHERFIPDDYKLSTPEQRVSLLQGLMDTDGEARKDGCVQYCTTSERLAEDVRFVVESLGGTARVSTKRPFYEHDGVRKEGRLAYVLTLALPDGINPFRAFAERYQGRVKYKPSRFIDSIEAAGEAEVVCISVSARDRLYVTEHCLVTHNTVQACASVSPDAPMVVVCPAVVKENWKDEMAMWRPDRRPAETLYGRGSFRWPGPGETIITNFAILPRVKKGEEVGAPHPGTVLVCDEAHNLKTLRVNRSAKTPDMRKSSEQAAAFYLMRKAVFAAGGVVWLLTGTPVMNRPDELWAILEQADLGATAYGSFAAYVRAWGGDFSGYGGSIEWGRPTEEVPERLRRVMLRREKRDVLHELPPKTYVVQPVEIDLGAVRELERELEAARRVASYSAQESPEQVVARELKILATAARAEQVEQDEGSEGLTVEEKKILASQSYGFEEISRAREILARAKYPLILPMVEKYEREGEPVLVFSAHLAPLRELAKRPGWALLDGSVPAEKRREIVKLFQAGQLRGVACSIKATGVGITLTKANTAIFLDRDWTPANNVQAEDRIWRIGQCRPVTIINVVATHEIDQMLAETIARKERMIQASVVAGSVTPNEIILPDMPVLSVTPVEIPEIPEFDPVAAGLVLGPHDPDAVRAEYDRRQAELERMVSMRDRMSAEERKALRAAMAKQPTHEQIARGGRRQAQSPLEEWAASAAVGLTGMDSDQALVQNEMGWSKADTNVGHQYAGLIVGHGGLVDEEWEDLIGRARKYWRQVGDPPDVVREGGKPAKRQVRVRVPTSPAEGEIVAGEAVMTPDGPGVVERVARKGRGWTYHVQLAASGPVKSYPGSKIMALGAPLALGSGEPEQVAPESLAPRAAFVFDDFSMRHLAEWIAGNVPLEDQEAVLAAIVAFHASDPETFEAIVIHGWPRVLRHVEQEGMVARAPAPPPVPQGPGGLALELAVHDVPGAATAIGAVYQAGGRVASESLDGERGVYYVRVYAADRFAFVQRYLSGPMGAALLSAVEADVPGPSEGAQATLWNPRSRAV